MTTTTDSKCVLDTGSLERLIPVLKQRGYEVVGPKLQDGAICYGVVETLEDLPEGWTDEQAPARYRLKRTDGAARFAYALGPNSWKNFLHPADVKLFQAERDNGTLRILESSDAPRQSAFLGVRACELAAIAIQDRVLTGGRYVDPFYHRRRDGLFVVAVHCTHPSSVCFCTSMGTGPRVKGSYDVALTEVEEKGGVYYVAEAGSAAGAEILQELEGKAAGPAEIHKAEAAVEAAASRMARRMDTSGIRELLYENFEHPRWDDVARRCLTCGNCTMSCPTCFCTTVEDGSLVTGREAERWRRWDSCFVQSFSYIHGGSVRLSPKSRYRQWLTHKLAAWIDQFGTSGCVGCGRCITWCPAGIDITEEVAAIRTGERLATVEGELQDGDSQSG